MNDNNEGVIHSPKFKNWGFTAGYNLHSELTYSLLRTKACEIKPQDLSDKKRTVLFSKDVFQCKSIIEANFKFYNHRLIFHFILSNSVVLLIILSNVHTCGNMISTRQEYKMPFAATHFWIILILFCAFKRVNVKVNSGKWLVNGVRGDKRWINGERGTNQICENTPVPRRTKKLAPAFYLLSISSSSMASETERRDELRFCLFPSRFDD